MAFDLSSQKIVLQPKPRIKDAILSIVSKHNGAVEEIQKDLNKLQSDVYGILGYNTKTSADASAGDTTLQIENPEYATVDAKFTIGDSDKQYTITDKSDSTITIDPALENDVASGTEIHILSKIDLEEINQSLDAINEVLNKDGGVNDVFDALIALATAWNNGKKIIDSVEVDFNGSAGMTVDLSAYSFESADDYAIGVSKNAKKPVDLSVEKVDEKTATINAIDLRYFAEDEVDYDASCDGCNFPVTIFVTYDRKPVHFTLTDLDGNEREA